MGSDPRTGSRGLVFADARHTGADHHEEVVVGKQAVPKERVRLDKDVVTGEQPVSETLQKEQIETERVDLRR